MSENVKNPELNEEALDDVTGGAGDVMPNSMDTVSNHASASSKSVKQKLFKLDQGATKEMYEGMDQ